MKELAVDIGMRVESDGYYGTVLYRGPVPPTKGVWLGVDWDDLSRGKHDGSHNGHRYFIASSPKSGSFIRETKATLGVSLIEAIHERYGRVDDEHAGIIQEELYVQGHNQQTTVEVVGAHSVNILQSQFDKLQEVVLRDCKIRSSGAKGEISALIPGVKRLDISKNLLNSWQEVGKISCQLPKLESLNVSDNRLQLAVNVECMKDAFSTVEIAFLNRMNYDWQQIAECTRLFDNLLELHACFNRVTSLGVITEPMHHLKLLNIESNPVTRWQDILSIGLLHSLEILIVNNTGLQDIHFPDVEHGQKTKFFCRVKSLSLSQNKITQWEEINELNKLQSLEDLKIKHNPLFEQKRETDCRYEIIARLGNLKRLNLSQVDAQERQSAEIDYLKTIGRSWRSSGGHQDPSKNHPDVNFTSLHPIFQVLLDKYGPPEDSELKEHSSALKNSLILLNIVTGMLPDKPPLSKKLPVSMTVQKLKTLLHRLYRVNTLDMELTYSSQKMQGTEIEMENDMKEIGFYSIEEGDTIHVKW